MKPAIKKAKDFLITHSLACFIVGVTIVSVVFTTVSISFYVSSGAINVDCSLPTDAEVCATVTVEDVNEKTLSPNGDFDKGTIYDFNMIFDEIMNEMSKMSTFNIDAMSDSALNLDE